MRAIFTLAGKDLKNILLSPLFFLIAGLCSVIWSYTFMRSLFMFAERTRQQGSSIAETGMNLQNQVFFTHISYANMLFIFLVPALTMRLISEEKRMRTYDLLLTAPITATEITIGKFLAGFGTVSVLIFISMLYPLGTRLVSGFPLAPLISAYAGVLLVAAAYVSIGLFASSLTDSPMLSLVMGMIFNMLLWFLAQSWESGGGTSTVSSILEYMSIGQHFLSFIVGSVKLNATVFLLSLTVLFTFMTQRVIESARWR